MDIRKTQENAQNAWTIKIPEVSSTFRDEVARAARIQRMTVGNYVGSLLEREIKEARTDVNDRNP